MNPERKRILILSGIIVITGIVLDQLTKWLCVRYLMPVGNVHLIPHLVDLTYVENSGAAFGMLKDHRWVFMVISVIALAAMTWILTTFREKKQTLYAIAVSLILSGGIGNMIDRVRLGYVIDFIDISPLFSFAVFNGADSFVCVGAALLVLALLLEWRQEEKRKEAAGSGADAKGGKEAAGNAGKKAADGKAENSSRKANTAPADDRENGGTEAKTQGAAGAADGDAAAKNPENRRDGREKGRR